jgi:hypothetical protein
MDRQTRLVWQGILSLTPSQRNELIDEWNRFVNSTEVKRAEKIAASESFRVVLGPVSGITCGCCGR